ncbi:MAG: site-2 protease family protein, partial [Candidatus Methanomethylophilaceae archaeon]|nr:site-2 protease family protein [Candidatus Methanomethylophilaceae archaeon]
VLVLISFMLHEFGHKLMAQKHGLWSEFRMFPAGLLLTLVMSFVGFLFAAPGAVMIQGMMDDRTNGQVSIAGPAVNIVFAAIGIVGALLVNGNPVVIFFYLLASLNAALAVFNLIPVPPLDGSKILRWNLAIWAGAIAVAAAEFLVNMFYVSGELYYYL